MIRRLRQLFRLAACTQLLPILESGDDPLIGGQAVLEGVMMRAPNSYCVAVRKPDGTIVTEEGPASRLADKSKFWALPIARGVGTLGQAMSLGMKALNFSAQHAVPEEEQKKDKDGNVKSTEIPKWMLALNVLFSLGLFIFLYKFIPLLATNEIQSRVTFLNNQVGFSFVEGAIRLSIFLGFLLLISRMKDIRRVFEYHGAEHKVVFNYESGKAVDVPTAQSFVTWHPRCGTSFLMVVMIVSILVYALVPLQGFAFQFLVRLALLPVIAGVSYEIIRFVAKRQGNMLSTVVAPGLWLQRVTTQPPADEQVEISIRALDGAMELEKQKGGRLVVA
ncbi:MAG: DUF1385 domain-containing protein [Acidobacteria bacterium]|nr:DUF1385 domain-containing protein [Acidobacteriota bacterium]